MSLENKVVSVILTTLHIGVYLEIASYTHYAWRRGSWYCGLLLYSVVMYFQLPNIAFSRLIFTLLTIAHHLWLLDFTFDYWTSHATLGLHFWLLHLTCDSLNSPLTVGPHLWLLGFTFDFWLNIWLHDPASVSWSSLLNVVALFKEKSTC